MRIVVALLLTAAAVWLFVVDQRELTQEVRLKADTERLDRMRAELQQRIDQYGVDIPTEQRRVEDATKVIAQLKQLQSTWDWFVGNREQQRLNDERLKRVEALHTQSSARVLALQQELARAKWERDKAQIVREQLDNQRREQEAKRTSIAYYPHRAWILVRSWIIFAFAVILSAPILAPLAAKLRRTGD